MKITIDTKEDSQDEIRNIIKMLSSLVDKEVLSNQGDVFSDEQKPEQPSDMFNMFSDNSKEDKSKKESDELDLGIPDIEEYD